MSASAWPGALDLAQSMCEAAERAGHRPRCRSARLEPDGGLTERQHELHRLSGGAWALLSTPHRRPAQNAAGN